MQTVTFSHHSSSTVAEARGSSTPQLAAEIPTLLLSRNDTFFPEIRRVMTQTLSLTPHGQTSAPRGPAQPAYVSTAMTREATGHIPRPADPRGTALTARAGPVLGLTRRGSSRCRRERLLPWGRRAATPEPRRERRGRRERSRAPGEPDDRPRSQHAPPPLLGK